MLSFTFNGKNSFDYYGILIDKRPNLPSPKRRVLDIHIPGRSSSLKYDENAYDDITISVECSIIDNVHQKIEQIKAWLLGSGENELVFSFQNNRKYIAQVVNSIDFEIVLKVSSKFIIIFNCRPFKYDINNSLIILNENNQEIINPGSFYSRPIINVLGNGNIRLKINSQELYLENINNKIILNSEIQDAYSSSLVNLNNHVNGEFPVLDLGSNLLSWIGNVSKVEILPNWRWL